MEIKCFFSQFVVAVYRGEEGRAVPYCRYHFEFAMCSSLEYNEAKIGLNQTNGARCGYRVGFGKLLRLLREDDQTILT